MAYAAAAREERARGERRAAEVLPEQRGAARGGPARAELADIDGGGGLAGAVRRLLDHGARAHGVIDGGGERGVARRPDRSRWTT